MTSASINGTVSEAVISQGSVLTGRPILCQAACFNHSDPISCCCYFLFCSFTGTGSLDLRTSQFLEQLRQNPTLGIMREQLAELLSEKVEKCGIPRGAPGISDQVLQNKLAMQQTQRKAYLQVS